MNLLNKSFLPLLVIFSMALTACELPFLQQDADSTETQEVQKADVEGHVVDGPIADAKVTLYSPDGDLIGEAYTDSEGYYLIENVVAYEYYQATAENGLLYGRAYPGQLRGRGPAAACDLSPFTTVVESLAEANEISYAQAEQELYTFLGIDEDPFMAEYRGEVVLNADMEALSYAIRSIPNGLAAWTDGVLLAYTKGVEPNPMWLEKIDPDEAAMAQSVWDGVSTRDRGDTVKANLTMDLTKPNEPIEVLKLSYYRRGNTFADRDVFIHFWNPPEVRNSNYLEQIRDGSRITDAYFSNYSNARKIISADYDLPFMSLLNIGPIDFSYEDVWFPASDTYSAAYPLETEYEGFPAYSLLVKKDDTEYSSYSYLDVTVLKDSGLIADVKLYAKEAPHALVKHCYSSELADLEGILTPGIITMENLIAGSKTEIEVTDIDYNLELDPNIFTSRNLEESTYL